MQSSERERERESNMVTISKILLITLTIFTKDAVLGRILRIVNGLDAYPEEIPYQVSLQFDDYFHFCGAAVLNKDFVITAAHCVFSKKKEEIRIVIGMINVENHDRIHNATSIYVHEEFKKPSHYANDIALIKVDPPMEFNEFVSPVVLPQKHQTVPVGTKVLTSGWGSEKGLELTLPLILKKVEVTVIDQELCSTLYERISRQIFPTQICTHEVLYERKGVCVGDSGGPVILDGVLIGIISWSRKDPDCASYAYPDVHTRVSEYTDWINNILINN